MVSGFLSSSSSAAGLLDYLLPVRDLQTITVTDTSEAGKLQPRPMPGHPLYYAAVSEGYCDLGFAKAGEKPIARQVVDRTMMKVLAKQGYLPAAPGQRPDLVLAWRWGTMNVERWSSPDGFQIRFTNEPALLRFLGGAKVGLVSERGDPFPEETLAAGLQFLGGSARNLLDTARDDLYVAIVAAYAPQLDGNGHATLLWNTRVSCPARGFWLPDALPAMLAIAAPYVGRETEKPVWIKASEKFHPDIQLGDMKLVEYLEQTKPLVIEVGPSS